MPATRGTALKEERSSREKEKSHVLRQEKTKGVDKRKKKMAKKPSASTSSTYSPRVHLSSFTVDKLQLYIYLNTVIMKDMHLQ